MEVEELLQLTLKWGHTLRVLNFSVGRSQEDSYEKVKQTRDKEDDGQDDDDEQCGWAYLVDQSEDIRVNNRRG